MYVDVTADGAVSLRDVDNFKAFKLAIAMPPGDIEKARAALRDIAISMDDKHAWIARGALRAFGHALGAPGWQQSFDALIEKAKPHGWVDEATGAIRAHIEWA